MRMKLVDSRQKSWQQRTFVTVMSVALCTGFLLLVRHGRVANGETRSSATVRSASDSAGESAMQSAVKEFASFPIARSNVRVSDGDVAYVAEGIGRMAAALELVVKEHVHDSTSLVAIGSQLRNYVVKLRKESDAKQEAAVTRDAFATASAAMTQLQEANFPELAQAATSLADDARQLDSDRPLDQQRDSVDRYFESAADVLRGMAGGTE